MQKKNLFFYCIDFNGYTNIWCHNKNGNRKRIKKKCKELHLAHFNKTTKIAQYLAERSEDAWVVVTILDLALHNYGEQRERASMQNQEFYTPDAYLNAAKIPLLEKLLNNNEIALSELRTVGLLK